MFVSGSRAGRIWKRVGLGTLALFALLVIAASIALWLGPPRDPKNFKLDGEDFGLGFKVGDSWDPDAFEAAMKARGIDVERDEPLPVECPFATVSWRAHDGTESVMALSDWRKPPLRLLNVYVQSDHPAFSGPRGEAKRLFQEAERLFPDDEGAQFEWISEQGAVAACESFPQVLTGGGIGFASSLSDVSATYGRPLVRTPFTADGPILLYHGDSLTCSLFFSRKKLTGFSLSPGYRNGGLHSRVSAWLSYFIGRFIMPWVKGPLVRYPSGDDGESK